MQFAINLIHLMKCFPKTFVFFFTCPSCKEPISLERGGRFKNTWKVIGQTCLPHLKWTKQTSDCQLSQVATAIKMRVQFCCCYFSIHASLFSSSYTHSHFFVFCCSRAVCSSFILKNSGYFMLRLTEIAFDWSSTKWVYKILGLKSQ